MPYTTSGEDAQDGKAVLRSVIYRLDQASADRASAALRVPATATLEDDPTYQDARAEHVKAIEAVDAELDRLFPRAGA